ncbi:MAG: methyltransferase domain-containing protein [Solirubrobacteraceae bacterium]
MHADALELLIAPGGGPLELGAAELDAGEALTGELVALDGRRFPIRNGIPRFAESGYAESFGEQWAWYRRVQLGDERQREWTRRRFVEGVRWAARDLSGRLILEAGCGAGRFTEVLLATGARVCSIDISHAVDACRANVGSPPLLVLAQADLDEPPFPDASFDFVFCFGVLQHTPNPRASFLRLARLLAPGGGIAVDVYAKSRRPSRWTAKYWVRPLTTRLSPRTLRRIVEWYVPRWLPIDSRLARVPKLGQYLVAVVPCWNYAGLLDDPEEIRAAAVLDTFDALSARYDHPQTAEAVREWFSAAELEEVDVRYGGNGIVANGTRPFSLDSRDVVGRELRGCGSGLAAGFRGARGR